MFTTLLLGDWKYFWNEMLSEFAHIPPSAWDSSLNTGLGKPGFATSWIDTYLALTAFITSLGLPWHITSLVFWIFPPMIISFISAFLLFKSLFKKNLLYAFISGIIYSTNTYFLLVFMGGQLGVTFGYALIPLSLSIFIKNLKNPTFTNSLSTTLILALQILFDPRLVYISMIAVLIYWLIFSFKKEKLIKQLFFSFTIPFILAILIHSYWILPIIFYKPAITPQGFTSIDQFKFFSFATIENAAGLLHPNWPENIFGKIGFMKPEFLIFTLFAFLPLIFIKIDNQKKNKTLNSNILFFSLIGIVGIFLAKGSSEPLGWINQFLFSNLPGMQMFRDSTKFYSLIAVSYSILIPIALLYLSKIFSKKNKKLFFIPSYSFVIIWFLVILLSSNGELFNKINSHQVPSEFVKLKNFLVKDKEFSRTLWIPQVQRYAFYSNIHPAVRENELIEIKDTNKLFNVLSRRETKKILQEGSVKYVIVPYDTEGEIFLTDREYDEKIYNKIISSLKKIDWLKEIPGFGKIKIFEVSDIKDHFWSNNHKLKISYEFINPSKYEVKVGNAKVGDKLIFSESFDPNWVAYVSDSEANKSIESNKFVRLNSFDLTKRGNYSLTVYYTPQKMVDIGLIISVSTFTLVTFSLFILIKIRGRRGK